MFSHNNQTELETAWMNLFEIVCNYFKISLNKTIKEIKETPKNRISVDKILKGKESWNMIQNDFEPASIIFCDELISNSIDEIQYFSKKKKYCN